MSTNQIITVKIVVDTGLAKWMSRRLEGLIGISQTTVKSPVDFIHRIRDLKLEDNEVMISFDVVSLFTSIPQELAMNTVQRLLLQDGEHNEDSEPSVEDILELLRFCLDTIFTFNGKVYRQIKGTPMGSPVSGVIAEAVLRDLERKAMENLQPRFWARYVDDTFVIIKRDDKGRFFDVLNWVCEDV